MEKCLSLSSRNRGTFLLLLGLQSAVWTGPQVALCTQREMTKLSTTIAEMLTYLSSHRLETDMKWALDGAHGC